MLPHHKIRGKWEACMKINSYTSVANHWRPCITASDDLLKPAAPVRVTLTARNHWGSSRCTPHHAPWRRHSPGQYCTHRWTGQGTLTWSRCGCRRRYAWPCSRRRRQRWGGGERPVRPQSTGCCLYPKEQDRLAQSPLLDAPPGPPSSIWGRHRVVRRGCQMWVIVVVCKRNCYGISLKMKFWVFYLFFFSTFYISVFHENCSQTFSLFLLLSLFLSLVVCQSVCWYKLFYIPH